MVKRLVTIWLCCLYVFMQIPQISNGQTSYIKYPTIDTIKRLKNAVESHPQNLGKHEQFINAFDIRDPRILRQYLIWMKRFPKIATVPFALGKIYQEYDDSIGKKYLLKAINIDPNMAAPWEYLSFYASTLGNDAEASNDMLHATQLDPKNPDYAFNYAFLQRDGNPAKYDSLMLNVAYHFPNNEIGAEALYWLALLPYNKNERTYYYEMLYKMYVDKKSNWFIAGMEDYYFYLLPELPDKAFDIALRMILQEKSNRQVWKLKLVEARNFLEIRKLLEANNPAETAELLKQLNILIYKTEGVYKDVVEEKALALLQAEVSDANGKTRVAYDSLASFYSKRPSYSTRKALLNYGSKLGLDSLKVDSGIWNLRNNMAWSPTDFTLQSYLDGKPISLSQYRGKVILLTYWDPTCAPCRDEFPYFEAILKKFNKDSVAYLAINSYDTEDEYVLPLMKSEGYTFIPLHDDPNKPKGNLPVIHLLPTNFLFDQKGRVIFTDFQINDKNESDLELMINELLKTGNSSNSQTQKNNKVN